MAVEQKSTEKKHRASGSGGGGAGLGRFKIFRIIVTIALIIIVLLCLFGVINQRATGQGFLDGFLNASNQVSEVGKSVLFNDEDSPLEYNEDGVYFRDHTPEKNAQQQEEQTQN